MDFFISWMFSYNYFNIYRYTSFWNDCISSGLRGCILIELALRGRIELERAGMRRKSLLGRKVILKNGEPCGDVLLDEALKHIKVLKYWPDWNTTDTGKIRLLVNVFIAQNILYLIPFAGDRRRGKCSDLDWISFWRNLESFKAALSVEKCSRKTSKEPHRKRYECVLLATLLSCYNPSGIVNEFNICCRIYSNALFWLPSSGVLTTEKQNFLLFDMTTHPVTDGSAKAKLVRKVDACNYLIISESRCEGGSDYFTRFGYS